jgi:hypothetical protein
MSIPELEDENKLYMKHNFVSGDEATKFPYLTPQEITEYQIRGWRCAVCGHTRSECIRRNPSRSGVVGTAVIYPALVIGTAIYPALNEQGFTEVEILQDEEAATDAPQG